MKNLVCLFLLICSNFTKIISSELKECNYAKVNNECPFPHLINKIVKIEKVNDLDPICLFETEKIASVIRHLKPNQTGKIFYVKCFIYLDYILHESWVEKIDQDSAEKIYKEQKYDYSDSKDPSCTIL